LLKTIKQCTIHNKDGEEEDPFKIIDQIISRNTVAIFTKSFCPHCKRLKEFFADKHVAFKTLDLDLMGTQGVVVQAILKDRTGQSTVPSVWVFKKFIGKKCLKFF
jgi:glutaredoxin 3